MQQVRVVVNLSSVPLLRHLRQLLIQGAEVWLLADQGAHHLLALLVAVELEHHRALRAARLMPRLRCAHRELERCVAQLVPPAPHARQRRERPLLQGAIRIGPVGGVLLLNVEPARREAHLAVRHGRSQHPWRVQDPALARAQHRPKASDARPEQHAIKRLWEERARGGQSCR